MNTIGILLGASKFKVEGLESSEAFANAKASFAEYLMDSDGLSVPDDAVLDLFDSSLAPVDQLTTVAEFLAQQNARSESGNLTVVFYYVGHGFVRQNGTDLHWAVAHTAQHAMWASSLNCRDFLEIVKSVGANMRVFGIIDCCYAGFARGIMERTDMQSAVREVLVGTPIERGCALICSAGSKQRAYLLAEGTNTSFTHALIEVLRTGWGANDSKVLSPHELAELVRARLEASKSLRTSTPEVYDIAQDRGVLATTPFFPILINDKESKPMPSKARASDWSPENGDEVRAHVLHSRAIEMLPEITACLRGTRIHTDSYAYTYRAKTVERILDKVRRRVVDDGVVDYDVDRVTDILGVRVITLFNEDLHPIAIEVLNIALGETKLHPNPLLAHRLRQVRIYTTAPIDNPTTGASRLKRKITDRLEKTSYADLDVEISYRSDYSSIHMVFDIEDTKADPKDRPALVPIEIQIRTVFEDTWSRIDHVLRYSRSRQKRTADAKNVPVASERHLITLKALLDACSNFAETIREEMSAQTNVATFNIVSVESDFERMSKLLAVDDAVANEVMELLREKQAIDAARHTTGRKPTYSTRASEDIAERFGVTAEKISKKLRELQQPGGFLAADKLKNADAQFVLYTLRMEEGYCRTLSNQTDEQKQAQRIYRELADVFPDIPILLLRWGQTSLKVADYDTAIRAYERARNSFEAQYDLPINDQNWQFTAEQKTYISQLLHRVYGYACWKKWDALGRTSEEAVASLRKAWEITADGIPFMTETDGKLRSINNLLSYFHDMNQLEAKARTHFADLIDNKDWLKDNYKTLREGIDIDTDERLEMIDTIVVVASLLGEDDVANKAAKRAVDMALPKGAPEHFGREVTDAALRHAWEVLRPNG